MKTLDVYTDGSHLKHTSGRLGIGGVIIDNEKIVSEFSQEISPEYMKFMYKTSDCSNPTAEMLAVLVSLKNFSKYLKDCQKIVFHADYLGVKNWMEGKWKVKAPYIQSIKDDILEEIKTQNLIGKISFEWVKGHSGQKWNEYVDKLAKGERND